MNLLDLINRKPEPMPWFPGEKIPWHEPAFSARMLKEHLNQEHDAASRRTEKIDRQVEWIHRHLLGCDLGKVLDLGCGPGLYTCRLAKLGHTCTGIDYSPASIAYAAAFAADQEDCLHSRCTYIFEDMRKADYGASDTFDLAMLIYGEFNTFCPADAELILRKTWQALRPGGQLVLEAHTETYVRLDGISRPSWYTSKSGLFSEKPHLVLTESAWDEDSQATSRRYYVIDAATACLSCYAERTQAYSLEQYQDLLTRCGFTGLITYPSLTGQLEEASEQLIVLVAHKPLSAS